MGLIFYNPEIHRKVLNIKHFMVYSQLGLKRLVMNLEDFL